MYLCFFLQSVQPDAASPTHVSLFVNLILSLQVRFLTPFDVVGQYRLKMTDVSGKTIA